MSVPGPEVACRALLSSGAVKPRSLPPRTSAAPFAIAGLTVLLVGLALAWVIAQDTAAANSRDLPVNTFSFTLGQDHPWIAMASEGVSFFAGGAINVIVVPVALVILLIARQWRWAIFLAVSSQAGLLVSSTLKASVARERPPFADPTEFQRYLSFPSGHTFAGITVWLAMGVICWFVLPRPWSTAAGITLGVIGLLNGPSRLVLGKHWLTDVVGAWLVSSGWLLLVWAAWLWWLAPRSNLDQEPAAVVPAAS